MILVGDKSSLEYLLICLESLNPLYVFEAKTAMLLRIAQDRKGAERLLDAQIFTVLAQCEFVSCRPSGEESLMGRLTYLSADLS